MKRRVLSLVCACVVACVCVMSVYQLSEAERMEHLYPLSTHVVEVDRVDDVVTVEDSVGNLWSFFGCEDWIVGDGCAMLMDDMGTASIYDDAILATYYQA